MKNSQNQNRYPVPRKPPKKNPSGFSVASVFFGAAAFIAWVVSLSEPGYTSSSSASLAAFFAVFTIVFAVIANEKQKKQLKQESRSPETITEMNKNQAQEIVRKDTEIKDLLARQAEILEQLDKYRSDGLRKLSDYQTRESQTIQDLMDEVERLKKSPPPIDETALSSRLADLQRQVIETEEVVLLQSFGFYAPQYDFSKSEMYKSALERVRLDQKELIRAEMATTGNNNWTIDGSRAKGSKMVKDMQKLLLRSFNCECDTIISRVKYNNFEPSLKRITASMEAVSKLGASMNLTITTHYYDLKVKELHLALDYQQKKQAEKEEQKEARQLLREQAQLQKEIDAERQKLEKEQTHYQTALRKLELQIEQSSEDEKSALLDRKEELFATVESVEKALAEVDYRQANQRAGYVYVISNVGSFGEGVYKIGMTRRLDPQDRVDELGDASVPFNFDVHAMIFSDDAPALESALHRAFDDRKLNFVNTRREFFRVSLEEIKRVVHENFDKTVEFVEVADAEQWRESVKMREMA